MLDLQTGKIVEEFQQYVLPRDNPKLSDFCKTLTGISQVGSNVHYADGGLDLHQIKCKNVLQTNPKQRGTKNMAKSPFRLDLPRGGWSPILIGVHLP